LDECVESGRVKKDDIVLMASFGGGFTWGGVVMRW
jgi:3-oxoacyl-[acyl-carrier-protein] synthase-3